MSTIDQLNAELDQGLAGLDADLWARMRALGVTARWVDPFGGAPSTFTETLNGVKRAVPKEEFFKFEVWLGEELLVSGTVHRVPHESYALTRIIHAAQKLQSQGLLVL